MRFKIKCGLSFLQVLQWTKQRCLLLTSAMLAQKGSASSTTSGLFCEQWTTCLGETVWAWRQAVSMITDTLIIVATSMHGYNSGIYLEAGVPEALSNLHAYWFSSEDVGPQPSLLLLCLTLQDKPDSVWKAWVTCPLTENATFLTVWT